MLTRLTDALFHRRTTVVEPSDEFLRSARGVIHVGANVGQERRMYNRLGLPVVWIEPIPHVYEQLASNLKRYPDQRAIQALVTDTDGGTHTLNIANNRGASSSILEFKDHSEIWPEVEYVDQIELTGETLPAVLEREGIDRAAYDALVIDTQGAELLVLQGAAPILSGFKYVKAEVPNFEAYAGCCQFDDLAAFMAAHGFTEHGRHCFASSDDAGSYFDVVYTRAAAAVA